MAQVTSLHLARFARLPRRSKDVWQGGIMRMPMWLDGPDGTPFRPRGGVWTSLETGVVNVKIGEPDTADVALAVDALVELGLKFAQTRPTAIQVTDQALGEQIAQALGDPELAVTVAPRLDTVKALVERMAAETDGEPPPAALDGKGVTVERMRAFATAARDFYAAAPWRHLSDEDLIHVEAPSVARPFRHLTVLGGAGVTFGLGFYKSPEAFNDLMTAPDPATFAAGGGSWSLTFDAPWKIPLSDHDLWEEQGFPLAGPAAYPVMAWYGSTEGIRRPDARELADVETILLALSRTTEAEIDQGRWTLETAAPDGPRRVTFAIPDLLLPIEEPTVPASPDPLASTPATALARAQDLAYAALDAFGRRRIQIARKAIELSEDCADAYIILAEDCADLERARDLYAQAVAAGERALGPAVFTKDWPFWHDIRSRPYMRARFGLARCLDDLGQSEEAIAHYRELLRLNPSDNQGIRYSLLSALLLAGRDDDAGPLLQQYDDPSALWQYGWALWDFRREGDGPASRKQLRAAIRSNRYVPDYLTGDSEWDGFAPEQYAMGSREEAVVCVEELADAWDATPGAVEWLEAHTPRGKRSKRRRR